MWEMGVMWSKVWALHSICVLQNSWGARDRLCGLWPLWNPGSTRVCRVALSVLSVDTMQQNSPHVMDVKTDRKSN